MGHSGGVIDEVENASSARRHKRLNSPIHDGPDRARVLVFPPPREKLDPGANDTPRKRETNGVSRAVKIELDIVVVIDNRDTSLPVFVDSLKVIERAQKICDSDFSHLGALEHQSSVMSRPALPVYPPRRSLGFDADIDHG
jgi:hypothetical protein